MSNLWKADYLEAKYRSQKPRLPHTKKLLRLKHVPKKLSGLVDDAEIDGLIIQYKRDEFDKKWHLAITKLTKVVNKYPKQDMIVDKHQLVTSRAVRLIMSVLGEDDVKSPPQWINEEVRTIITEQTELHPTTFYKSLGDDKKKQSLVLKVWNSKAAKKLIAEIEWLLKMIRGKITKQDKIAHYKAMGINKPVELDTEDEEEEDLDQYAGMVAGLDDEDEDDDEDRKTVGLDGDLFFEGGSDTDDEEVKAKYNLPELAGGYYSHSDDEDEQPKKGPPAKLERKNRRGQRARQRLWEKKFGKEAKHVQSNIEKAKSEREQRQQEYEERCRKRREKEMLEEERNKGNPNMAPVGTKVAAKDEKVHPSWEAKRKAQEQLTAGFSGKKIKFD